ncbi:hypothetical protein [Halalkalibacter hemicellulosilyticus]|uniref:Uncharacterized protein n=1 Tax=Halalkalibacter hemicellulosilyticusJCM 9152 TaxID=1236971 RepID=W4QLU8_9BACI|nr:hypothetical protein [Halalkalibacter hemicellulosilyticus]GAE32872.1 hypothetical protein JCM9152_4463 [Halalkalibacter hemicellulosilyticusJCM 9152]
MIDAFIYFFFIGSGTATGVSVVGLLVYKYIKRQNEKAPKKARKKKGGLVDI